jgi:hypothetical protein
LSRISSEEAPDFQSRAVGVAHGAEVTDGEGNVGRRTTASVNVVPECRPLSVE